MRIKTLVSGALGKMGRELHKAIASDKSFVYAGGIDKKTDSIVKPIYKSFSNVKEDVDAVVDFSSPEVFDSALNWCEKSGTLFVSGTTGLSDSQTKAMMKAAKKIPIFWASNMSVGMAVVNEMLKNFSALDDYDFQIEEFHHNQKKDSPSGTAKTLQAKLEKILKGKLPPPISIRGGGTFGIHSVYSMGPEETILLQHTALNRTVFAKGALRAAKFLLKKKNGFYSMNDLVKACD